MGLVAIGSVVLTWLAFVKFGLGEPIGGRPLLLFGFFCVIAGAQFVSTGVLAETLARIYFESGAAELYRVRHPEAVGDGDDGASRASAVEAVASRGVRTTSTLPSTVARPGSPSCCRSRCCRSASAARRCSTSTRARSPKRRARCSSATTSCRPT